MEIVAAFYGVYICFAVIDILLILFRTFHCRCGKRPEKGKFRRGSVSHSWKEATLVEERDKMAKRYEREVEEKLKSTFLVIYAQYFS